MWHKNHCNVHVKHGLLTFIHAIEKSICDREKKYGAHISQHMTWKKAEKSYKDLNLIGKITANLFHWYHFLSFVAFAKFASIDVEQLSDTLEIV